MRRMIDAKKLKEIEANGGTQWYKHKLTKSNNTSIEFVFPFEKSLLELVEGYISNRKVFGALL